MFFVEFHVADQGGAGVARFQQIVAENGVLRKASGHGSLEGVHIVNSFADERAFLEKILIHVGHLPRVRIDAGLAGEKPGEPGSPGAGQTDAHARLQNAVAFDDTSVLGIELADDSTDGPSCRPAAGGIARHLGVGVERDDILDGRQDGRLPHDLGKGFARTAAEAALNSMSLPRLRS